MARNANSYLTHLHRHSGIRIRAMAHPRTLQPRSQSSGFSPSLPLSLSLSLFIMCDCLVQSSVHRPADRRDRLRLRGSALLAFHPRRIAVSAIAPARADSARRPLDKYRLADKSTVASTRGKLRASLKLLEASVGRFSRRSTKRADDVQASYREHRNPPSNSPRTRARSGFIARARARARDRRR